MLEGNRGHSPRWPLDNSSPGRKRSSEWKKEDKKSQTWMTSPDFKQMIPCSTTTSPTDDRIWANMRVYTVKSSCLVSRPLVSRHWLDWCFVALGSVTLALGSRCICPKMLNKRKGVGIMTEVPTLLALHSVFCLSVFPPPPWQMENMLIFHIFYIICHIFSK